MKICHKETVKLNHPRTHEHWPPQIKMQPQRTMSITCKTQFSMLLNCIYSFFSLTLRITECFWRKLALKAFVQKTCILETLWIFCPDRWILLIMEMILPDQNSPIKKRGMIILIKKAISCQVYISVFDILAKY